MFLIFLPVGNGVNIRSYVSYIRWNLENPMVIHGEPPPWRKKVKFVGPRLDFEGSLYDDYNLIEPPVNFNLDDEIAEE